MSGIFNRLRLVFRLQKYQWVFIHRESCPVGPPVIEWIIKFILQKKIIYDFDDAIWLTDKAESFLEKSVRARNKIASICKWSYRISCGNAFLASYARQYNQHVTIFPSIVDTQHHHNPTLYAHQKNTPESITLGWTGSQTTLKYLRPLLPVFEYLKSKYPALSILIIADEVPEFGTHLWQFRKWSKETEASDLLAIDIGVMPLPDDAWAQGKCGFKLIQYMSMGIPAVASPVGVNKEIINDTRGRLALTEADWVASLSELIENEPLRKELGNAGRKYIEQHYSVEACSSTFLSLFLK